MNNADLEKYYKDLLGKSYIDVVLDLETYKKVIESIKSDFEQVQESLDKLRVDGMFIETAVFFKTLQNIQQELDEITFL